MSAPAAQTPPETGPYGSNQAEETPSEMATANPPAVEPSPVETPVRQAPPPEPPRAEKRQVPSLAAAVDDVRRIVESLEEALEQMEHVLELVELAEEQKMSDEREIENLRRALRRLQQGPRHEPPRDRRSDYRREGPPRGRGETVEPRQEDSRASEPVHEAEPEMHEEGSGDEFGPEEHSG